MSRPNPVPNPEGAAAAEPQGVATWGLGWRERSGMAVLVLVPVLAVAVIVAALWQPGPPARVVMSTGATDGAYHAFAQRYREVLARSGVELVLLPSAGAAENLERLRSGDQGVSLALIQGGLVEPRHVDGLEWLGAVAHEPIWVFHRASATPRSLRDFRGARIAGGQPGSGTRMLVDRMLAMLGMDGPGLPAPLPLSGLAAADALENGTVDVAILVAAPDAPAVQRLLRSPRAALLSWDRAEAYVRQLPVLSRVDIPEGAVDLAHNLPPRDVVLLSLRASLVARSDTHPVLVELLLDAAREVHGGSGLLQRNGDFPSEDTGGYPLSLDAKRYFKNGPSALRSVLPYWSVVWIQRLIFIGLPVIAVGIPLLRVLPWVYRWAVRRRIYRWYAELSQIERDMDTAPARLDAQLRRLDALEARFNRMRVPASFGAEAYSLREHVQLIRERLRARAAAG
jgi:TRAP-type uncharacterized transport system substrate-binding protein